MFSCEYADPCCKIGPEGPTGPTGSTGPTGPTGPILGDHSVAEGVGTTLNSIGTPQYDTNSFTPTATTGPYILGGGQDIDSQNQSVLLGPAGIRNGGYGTGITPQPLVGPFNQFIWMEVTKVDTGGVIGLPTTVYVPAYWER